MIPMLMSIGHGDHAIGVCAQVRWNTHTQWQALKLGECSNVSKVTAALAVAYSEFFFKVKAKAFGIGGEKFDELLKWLGYQLGLDIDPSTRSYRWRSPH